VPVADGQFSMFETATPFVGSLPKPLPLIVIVGLDSVPESETLLITEWLEVSGAAPATAAAVATTPAETMRALSPITNL
jgi:hypothetical protein